MQIYALSIALCLRISIWWILIWILKTFNVYETIYIFFELDFHLSSQKAQK